MWKLPSLSNYLSAFIAVFGHLNCLWWLLLYQRLEAFKSLGLFNGLEWLCFVKCSLCPESKYMSYKKLARMQNMSWENVSDGFISSDTKDERHEKLLQWLRVADWNSLDLFPAVLSHKAGTNEGCKYASAPPGRRCRAPRWLLQHL